MGVFLPFAIEEPSGRHLRSNLAFLARTEYNNEIKCNAQSTIDARQNIRFQRPTKRNVS